MERSFGRSLLYSAMLHGLLLLALWLAFKDFLVVRTPLLMELTLIGQMSKGEGLGSNAAHPGEESGQSSPSKSGGEFDTPRRESAIPPVPPAPKPETAVRKPLPPKKDPGVARSEAYLQSLRRTAPIGLAPREGKDDIKTTAGLGPTGTAGAPDGSPAIEGELAARSILNQVKPDYPLWARKQGIEGVIKYRLTVLPNGLIKLDDLQLDQTSGYTELDREVYKALIRWEFEALAPQVPQVEQSGVITFTFHLTEP